MSAVAVEGGHLEVVNCDFVGDADEQGGSSHALDLSGGETTAINSRFTAFASGAITMTNGSLSLIDSEVRRNAADKGAALQVTAGRAEIAGTVFEQNEEIGRAHV